MATPLAPSWLLSPGEPRYTKAVPGRVEYHRVLAGDKRRIGRGILAIVLVPPVSAVGMASWLDAPTGVSAGPSRRVCGGGVRGGHGDLGRPIDRFIGRPG